MEMLTGRMLPRARDPIGAGLCSQSRRCAPPDRVLSPLLGLVGAAWGVLLGIPPAVLCKGDLRSTPCKAVVSTARHQPGAFLGWGPSRKSG